MLSGEMDDWSPCFTIHLSLCFSWYHFIMVFSASYNTTPTCFKCIFFFICKGFGQFTLNPFIIKPMEIFTIPLILQERSSFFCCKLQPSLRSTTTRCLAQGRSTGQIIVVMWLVFYLYCILFYETIELSNFTSGK